MQRHDAPAWRADWINGWLAAIGCTVICEDLKLSWTDAAHPTAILWAPDDGIDIGQRISEAFPPHDFIRLSAARDLTKQEPSEDQYRVGSEEARLTGDWLWSALFTDLVDYRSPKAKATPGSSRVAKSIFYPGVEKGRTIADRFEACWESPSQCTIEASMSGTLARKLANGLGFDCRRIFDPSDPHPKPIVDPIVEVLIATALVMFPVRGDGRRERTKGQNAGRSFRWRTWPDPLNAAAIDAIVMSSAPVEPRYELVEYDKGVSAKTGYFSRRIPS